MKIYSVVDWNDYSSFGRHFFYLTEEAARKWFVHMTTVAHHGLYQIKGPEQFLDVARSSDSPTTILDCWGQIDHYGLRDAWLLLEIEIGDDHYYDA